MAVALVFLPGESQGQRSLVGYSSWGHKELDVTSTGLLADSEPVLFTIEEIVRPFGFTKKPGL